MHRTNRECYRPREEVPAHVREGRLKLQGPEGRSGLEPVAPAGNRRREAEERIVANKGCCELAVVERWNARGIEGVLINDAPARLEQLINLGVEAQPCEGSIQLDSAHHRKWILRLQRCLLYEHALRELLDELPRRRLPVAEIDVHRTRGRERTRVWRVRQTNSPHKAPSNVLVEHFPADVLDSPACLDGGADVPVAEYVSEEEGCTAYNEHARGARADSDSGLPDGGERQRRP